MQVLFAVLLSTVCFRVPQFNVFGHAAGARSISGRHAAFLDPPYVHMGIDGYAETGWIDVQVNRN